MGLGCLLSQGGHVHGQSHLPGVCVSEIFIMFIKGKERSAASLLATHVSLLYLDTSKIF